jgi:DNA replication and repair protein RecF
MENFERNFKNDIVRKYTTQGPHADEIEFTINGMVSKKFASQGQQRTLVLAAKIAETKVLAKICGRIPLLLLDDISSELDKDRNRALFKFLSTTAGQVFITTTHNEHILIEKEKKDFYIENGKVTF